ncbi:cell division protein FtsH [Candidatus Marinamargulisbacteria bacterium SCGC AAA071-K20]|nr:cell division protein FtsH [Candidatus Marinamargulisbacteria bacterium SCGC AAA071-K20]
MAKKKKAAKNKANGNKKDWRTVIWYFLIALMALSIVTTYVQGPQGQTQMQFSEFMSEVEKGNITELSIRRSDQTITGATKSGTEFKTYYINYPELVPELRKQGVAIKVNPTDSGWVWSIFIQALLPFIFIGLLWFFIFRQAQGMNSQAMSFGKNKSAAWQKKDQKEIKTFKDVAGVDEAIEELEEIVEFLKHPKKYKDIGAKIPKGALLMGPPGTGKTLLAKAIAGEADVPFFSLSGSEFVEMFVGVGASRVRDLFAQAKKSAPSIIFVDEIDAVGRHRGSGLGGGHDEREQTLNQLLVEMDGFSPTETVIVIAATNRPDILDPALLRPGRFDRQIVVDKPDVGGRLSILKIHAKGKKLGKDINLEIIAKRTPGFTGADLANLINEGALLSARKNNKEISMTELEEATDRVIAGPERKSKIIETKEKEIVAYHELGHAIVAIALPGSDPVHKISILPRGQALGYTLQLPVSDKHLMSKLEIENQIKVLMGGRIAEDLIFNEITSGASNDIERATNLARSYVCQYGMSKKLGARKYGNTSSQVFLGKSYSDQSKDYSEETAHDIDTEIRELIETCYKDAKTILVKHKKKLISLSKLLIEKEVLDGPEFSKLFGKEVVTTA